MPPRWSRHRHSSWFGRVDRNPGNSGSDAAQDLVTDGAERLGPFISRDLFVPLSTQQHHLVTWAHRVVISAVDHDLVHGDHAGQRTASSTDEHAAATGEEPSGHPI